MRTLEYGWWLLGIGLAGLFLGIGQVRAEVYATSDTYKLDPVDGSIVAFGHKPPGKLAEGNAVWKSSENQISIGGGRNAILGFNLMFTGPGSYKLETTALSGAGTIEAGQLRFFLVAGVKAGDKWVSDICYPLGKGGGVKEFSIPHAIGGLAPSPTQKAQQIYVEVRIPPDAKPGTYQGTITAGERKLKLRLGVWNYVIPKKRGFLFDLNSYGSPYKIHGNEYGLEKGRYPVESQYYQMAHRHRMYLNCLPYKSQRGNVKFGPKVTLPGPNAKVDFKNFDAVFGKYLDGSAFEDGQPIEAFYLPFNPEWPHKQTTSKRNDPRQTESYEACWKAVSRAYIEHFKKKGWTEPVYQVYLNQKPQKGRNKVVWKLDEPTDMPDYKALKYFCALAKAGFKDSGPVKMAFRLDIGHFFCRNGSTEFQCYKAKGYTSDAVTKVMQDIDWWYIGHLHLAANVEKARALRALDSGKRTFVYGGFAGVGRTATANRSIPWAGYLMHLDGWCAWNVGSRAVRDPLLTKDSSWVWYNNGGKAGERIQGFDGPVLASYRMKVMRRGLQDWELLKLAEAKAGKDEVRKTVEDLFTWKVDKGSSYWLKTENKAHAPKMPAACNNPEDYEIARFEMISKILGQDLTRGTRRTGNISGAPLANVSEIIVGYD